MRYCSYMYSDKNINTHGTKNRFIVHLPPLHNVRKLMLSVYWSQGLRPVCQSFAESKIHYNIKHLTSKTQILISVIQSTLVIEGVISIHLWELTVSALSMRRARWRLRSPRRSQVRSASAINCAGRLAIYREWRSPEDQLTEINNGWRNHY